MASEQAHTRNSDVLTRVVSAAILAPVALAAVFLGGPFFAALVILVAAIGYWEWTAIGKADQPLSLRVLGLACLVGGLAAVAAFNGSWMIVVAIPAVLAVLAGAKSPKFRWIGLGLAYVAIPCAAFLLFRESATGIGVIIYILAVVWATDIAAYFGGRAIGGAKLWPSVSPKKTWSGAISGLVAAMAAGGFSVLLMGNGDVLSGLLIAAPLSVAAQGGDLLESAVKRKFGVKDSGSIIPGHGGVLDRVDGLFGAAALAWLIAALGLGGATLTLPAGVVAVTGGGA